jgi:hypothetical protein
MKRKKKKNGKKKNGKRKKKKKMKNIMRRLDLFIGIIIFRLKL